MGFFAFQRRRLREAELRKQAEEAEVAEATPPTTPSGNAPEGDPAAGDEPTAKKGKKGA